MTSVPPSSAERRAAVARKIDRLARARARLQELQAVLGQELEAVRQRHARRLVALQDRAARLGEDLENYCRTHRHDVLPPGRRTLATPLGEIGFRRAEPVVRLCPEVTEEEACRLLRRNRLGRLLRVKEAPDKPAVRKALREGRISAEQLRRCGLELVSGPDSFRCKVRADVLAVAEGVG